MTLLAMEAVALVRGGRTLLQGFDLSLGAGEAVQLSGPNGVGKSSLLRLAAGLLDASAGRVERGADVALADDALALDRSLPLRRALDFWGGRVEAGMAAMGLEALGEAPVRLLSTGQRKRAGLARLIASGAPLWLLDEPLNGLDRDGAERLGAAVAAHRAGGGAVLAASHLPLGPDWRAVPLGGER